MTHPKDIKISAPEQFGLDLFWMLLPNSMRLGGVANNNISCRSPWRFIEWLLNTF